MSNPHNPKRYKLTHKHVVGVGKLLEGVCSTDANGFATYADDWSDRKVTEAMRKEIPWLTEAAVGNLRRNLFGNFKRDGRNTKPTPDTPDLSVVIDRITKLEADLNLVTNLEDIRVTKLENKLENRSTKPTPNVPDLSVVVGRIAILTDRITKLEKGMKNTAATFKAHALALKHEAKRITKLEELVTVQFGTEFGKE